MSLSAHDCSIFNSKKQMYPQLLKLRKMFTKSWFKHMFKNLPSLIQ